MFAIFGVTMMAFCFFSWSGNAVACSPHAIYPLNFPNPARNTAACIRYTSEAVAVRRSVLRGVEALVPASFSERGQFIEVFDGGAVGEQGKEVDDRPVVVLFFMEVVNPLVVGNFGIPSLVGLGQEADPVQERSANLG